MNIWLIVWLIGGCFLALLLSWLNLRFAKNIDTNKCCNHAEKVDNIITSHRAICEELDRLKRSEKNSAWNYELTIAYGKKLDYTLNKLDALVSELKLQYVEQRPELKPSHFIKKVGKTDEKTNSN